MKERRDTQCGARLFVSADSTFKLKTWTVPLSLETASHWAFKEKQRLKITALSEPLLSYICSWNSLSHNNNVEIASHTSQIMYSLSPPLPYVIFYFFQIHMKQH